MRNAKSHALTGYTENHHIFPKSIYGDNDSTVLLTATVEQKKKISIAAKNRKYKTPKHKITILNKDSNEIKVMGVKDIIKFLSCTTYKFYKHHNTNNPLNGYIISK